MMGGLAHFPQTRYNAPIAEYSNVCQSGTRRTFSVYGDRVVYFI